MDVFALIKLNFYACFSERGKLHKLTLASLASDVFLGLSRLYYVQPKKRASL